MISWWVRDINESSLENSFVVEFCFRYICCYFLWERIHLWLGAVQYDISHRNYLCGSDDGTIIMETVKYIVYDDIEIKIWIDIKGNWWIIYELCDDSFLWGLKRNICDVIEHELGKN
jgi:hypothetical protein